MIVPLITLSSEYEHGLLREAGLDLDLFLTRKELALLGCMVDLRSAEAKLLHGATVELLQGALNRHLDILRRLGGWLSLRPEAVTEHPPVEVGALDRWLVKPWVKPRHRAVEKCLWIKLHEVVTADFLCIKMLLETAVLSQK